MERHVFEHTTEAEQTRHSAAYLDSDGRLVVEIHDVGGMFAEYESFETFSIDQTRQLTEVLGGDLMAQIAARFSTTAELSKYAESTGVGRGQVWNHIDP